MSAPCLAWTLRNAAVKKASAKPTSFFLRVPRNSNVLAVTAIATALSAARMARLGSVSINCNASSMCKSAAGANDWAGAARSVFCAESSPAYLSM
jgi:hypothetical protein